MKQLVFTMITFAFILSSCVSALKSDERMIAHFEANKPAFEALVQSLNSMTEWFITLGHSCETQCGEDVKAVRAELERLGLYSINGNPGSDFGVTLSVPRKDNIFTAFGLTSRSGSKGYVYLEDPPQYTIEDLDEIEKRFHGFYYRHIEDGWYLYLYDNES